MGVCGQELSQRCGACRRQVLGPGSAAGLLRKKDRLLITAGRQALQEYGSQSLALTQLDRRARYRNSEDCPTVVRTSIFCSEDILLSSVLPNGLSLVHRCPPRIQPFPAALYRKLQ